MSEHYGGVRVREMSSRFPEVQEDQDPGLPVDEVVLARVERACARLLRFVHRAVRARPVEAVPLDEWSLPTGVWAMTIPPPRRWPITKETKLSPDAAAGSWGRILWADRRGPYTAAVLGERTAVLIYAGQVILFLDSTDAEYRTDVEHVARYAFTLEHLRWRRTKAEWARIRERAIVSAKAALAEIHRRVPAPTAAIHLLGYVAAPDAVDTVEALVGLARDGRKNDFCWLAGSAGVPHGLHDELWTGTRRRLNKDDARRGAA